MNTSRARRYCLVLFCVACASAFLAWLLWPDHVRPARFRQLTVGMTIREVEAIMDIPPGDYYPGRRGVGGVTSRGPWGRLIEEVGVHLRDVAAAESKGI